MALSLHEDTCCIRPPKFMQPYRASRLCFGLCDAESVLVFPALSPRARAHCSLQRIFQLITACGTVSKQLITQFHALVGVSGVDENDLNVRGAAAFASPDTLAHFVQFLRAHSEKLGARAVCSVIPKKVVAYPQVWKMKDWPCGDGDGVFVQLESRANKTMWFMGLEGRVPEKPVVVPYDFAVLPALIR